MNEYFISSDFVQLFIQSFEAIIDEKALRIKIKLTSAQQAIACANNLICFYKNKICQSKPHFVEDLEPYKIQVYPRFVQHIKTKHIYTKEDSSLAKQTTNPPSFAKRNSIIGMIKEPSSKKILSYHYQTQEPSYSILKSELQRTLGTEIYDNEFSIDLQRQNYQNRHDRIEQYLQIEKEKQIRFQSIREEMSKLQQQGISFTYDYDGSLLTKKDNNLKNLNKTLQFGISNQGAKLRPKGRQSVHQEEDIQALQQAIFGRNNNLEKEWRNTILHDYLKKDEIKIVKQNIQKKEESKFDSILNDEYNNNGMRQTSFVRSITIKKNVQYRETSTNSISITVDKQKETNEGFPQIKTKQKGIENKQKLNGYKQIVTLC